MRVYSPDHRYAWSPSLRCAERGIVIFFYNFSFKIPSLPPAVERVAREAPWGEPLPFNWQPGLITRPSLRLVSLSSLRGKRGYVFLILFSFKIPSLPPAVERVAREAPRGESLPFNWQPGLITIATISLSVRHDGLKEGTLHQYYLLGCGVKRRYGFTSVNPLGNLAGISSVLMAVDTTTGSPSFQSAGVDTLW